MGKIAYLCSVKMKQSHTILLLLALSILLSSVGIGLSEKLCRMAGFGAMAAPASSECCLSTDTSDSDCCEEHVSYEKLEPVSTIKHLQVPVFFLTVAKPLLPQQPVTLLAAEVLTYSDNSPPLAGRKLLQRYQVLIV